MFSLKSIIILLVFIIVVHILALINHWYWTYQWLDIPMHFLGGFWTAATLIALNLKLRIKNLELFNASNYLITVIMTLSFAALIGVFLEFAEFLYDIFISSRGYFGFLQLGAADTIADLFFDLLGAFVFIIIYRVIANNVNSKQIYK